MTAARKLDPSPLLPERGAQHAASLSDLLAQELESADVEGFAQAAEKYGADFERELADLEAGRHPLQRRKRAR